MRIKNKMRKKYVEQFKGIRGEKNERQNKRERRTTKRRKIEIKRQNG